MREVLFRGRAYDGRWVFGSLIQETATVYIREPLSRYPDMVDPKTVGQYTGHKDAGGEKIFEGDIVLDTSENETAVVSWDERTAMFCIEFDGVSASFDNYYGPELEIVGNIHDEEGCGPL